MSSPTLIPHRPRNWKSLPHGVTTYDIRCTKGLDIRLISGLYPVVVFGQKNAVFSDSSSLFDHRYLADI